VLIRPAPTSSRAWPEARRKIAVTRERPSIFLGNLAGAALSGPP